MGPQTVACGVVLRRWNRTAQLNWLLDSSPPPHLQMEWNPCIRNGILALLPSNPPSPRRGSEGEQTIIFTQKETSVSPSRPHPPTESEVGASAGKGSGHCRRRR